MDKSETTPVAAMCTLPAAERAARSYEFDRLFAAALRAPERPEPGRLRLAMDPSPEVAGRAADLLAREVGCCSFFTFTLTLTAGGLALDVAVPEAQSAVLDGMADRVAASAG